MALHGTCYVVGERGPTGSVTEFDTHGRVDRRGDNDTLLKKKKKSGGERMRRASGAVQYCTGTLLLQGAADMRSNQEGTHYITHVRLAFPIVDTEETRSGTQIWRKGAIEKEIDRLVLASAKKRRGETSR